MKKFTISLLTLFIAVSACCQSYYWVGNGGNWSDLSHWATTSGGNTFHNTLPGPENDVFFDANSFTQPGQVVTIDLEESYCRDFTANGVQFSPTINGIGFYDKLYVHGHFEMGPEMDRSFKMIYMMSDEETAVTTGEKFLGGFLQFHGTGPFNLQDSVSAGNVYVIGAELNTNNHPVHASQRIYGLSGNPTLNLGTSNIYTPLWWVVETTLLDATNATIYFSAPTVTFGDFYGGGKHYHRVVFSGLIDIMDNNSFDVFEVLPGSDISLTAGTTQTAENFELIGTAVEPIYIGSTEVGVQASLAKSSGVVNGQYLVLQDNAAIGGAEFNAEESLDLGNNTGWNISITVPLDYYWVGGPGDWSDMTHWATSSGGNVLHDSPPSAIDHVYFDENSGLAEGDVVSLGNMNRSCKDFTVTGINVPALIQQSANGQLYVYGNFLSDGEVLFGLGNLNLLSEEEMVLSVNSEGLGNNCKMVVNTQSDVQLLTPLSLRTLELLSGNFLANGNDLTLDFEFEFLETSAAFADLSNLVLDVRLFNNFSPDGQLLIDNTEIFSSGVFRSNGQDYYRITFEGAGGSASQLLSTSFSVEEMIVLPGAILELQAGMTVTTGSLMLNGTSGSPIEIFSSVEGTEATFSQSSGMVNGNYLVLKDNHATGGAVFLASNSQFLDNVEGWNVTTGTEDKYTSFDAHSFPNPAVTEVNVKGYAGETLKVFNLAGQLVHNQALSEGWNAINIQDLAPGLYLMQKNNPLGDTRNERLVVQ